MIKNNIVFLSRWIPPKIDGVGDYTRHLVQALRQAKKDAVLVTSSLQSTAQPWEYSLIDDWGKSVTSSIRRFEPRWICVQYVPSLFGKYGICSSFIGSLARLKQELHCKLAVTFHEFTVEAKMDPKTLFLKWILDAQTKRLLGLCDAAVVTCARYNHWLRRMDPSANVSTVPVGASILPEAVSEEKKKALYQKHKIENAKVLTIFGRLSSFRNYPVSLRVLAEARKEGIPAVLLLLGGMRSSNPAMYEELLNLAHKWNVEKYLIETGNLDADDISSYLQMTDVFLFPQSDGVSTRNTTLMSALAHGLPVAAYAPVPGNFEGYEIPFGSLAPRENQEAFIRAAVQLLKDAQGSAQKKERNRQYFADHFSWNKIAESYAELLV